MPALAPITPSAQQLYDMNMRQLRPNLDVQAQQYQQAQQLLQAQIELQKQRQQQGNAQFYYSQAPWYQQQAQRYVGQQFPQYTQQNPMAAAGIRHRMGRRGGDVIVNPYMNAQGGAPAMVAPAPQWSPSPATGAIMQPDQSWGGPVSAEQAVAQQQAQAPGMTGATPAWGVQGQEGPQSPTRGFTYMGENIGDDELAAYRQQQEE